MERYTYYMPDWLHRLLALWRSRGTAHAATGGDGRDRGVEEVPCVSAVEIARHEECPLDIKWNPRTNCLLIEGVRYHVSYFQGLALSSGSWIRVIRRDDGVMTCWTVTPLSRTAMVFDMMAGQGMYKETTHG